MGAYGGVEKGTLAVEEGTCEKDTLGWMRNAHMGSRRTNED